MNAYETRLLEFIALARGEELLPPVAGGRTRRRRTASREEKLRAYWTAVAVTISTFALSAAIAFHPSVADSVKVAALAWIPLVFAYWLGKPR